MTAVARERWTFTNWLYCNISAKNTKAISTLWIFTFHLPPHDKTNTQMKYSLKMKVLLVRTGKQRKLKHWHFVCIFQLFLFNIKNIFRFHWFSCLSVSANFVTWYLRKNDTRCEMAESTDTTHTQRTWWGNIVTEALSVWVNLSAFIWDWMRKKVAGLSKWLIPK